uniref:RNA-directed DNA polymerase, eukaryota n=1 Tax=Tanacetum cinerariifolium TaxID=118510 RepID=A0A6L2MGK4_TANCI|nr:RNA-directed DNA polymerase, eukaryota [Tanacetum cinerariifolium]
MSEQSWGSFPKLYGALAGDEESKFKDKDLDNVKGDSYVEKVSETGGMQENEIGNDNEHSIHEEENLHSSYPFNIYELLQKKKDNINQTKRSDPTHPCGFTPELGTNNKEEETKMESIDLFSIKMLSGNLTFDLVVSSYVGLVDLPLGGYSYTWVHKLASKMSKINRFLILEGDDEICIQRTFLLKDLNDITNNEALELSQKAKIRWSIEGDENSKYFHEIPNSKRSQLAIRGILHDGDWIESIREFAALKSKGIDCVPFYQTKIRELREYSILGRHLASWREVPPPPYNVQVYVSDNRQIWMSVFVTSLNKGFAAALAVLITEASQSRQHGLLLTACELNGVQQVFVMECVLM